MVQNKVFVIGIDGGSWNVLNPMMEQGILPHLDRHCKKGTYGPLLSTIPPVTAPAWASFQTGVNPGKHGVYDFNEYKSGSYSTTFASANSIKSETLWKRLSDHGKKIIALNVPMTYPPKPLNGKIVTGMLTPSTRATFTYPASLAEEILKIEKDYVIITTQQYYNMWDLDKFIDKLIETEKKRLTIGKYLIQNYDWDLSIVHFHSSDVLQHAVYCYLDDKDARFDRNAYKKVCRFYAALDKYIGDIVQNLPSSILLIVISDHGFGPVSKTININNLLIEAGYIQLRKSGLIKKNLPFLMDILRKIDKKYVRSLLSPSRRARIRAKVRLDKLINWNATKAFMINGWVYGNIYINRLGREPKGIVQPGKQYHELREALTKLFLDIKDSKTGQNIIKNVIKTEDVYSGGYVGDAPDLILVPEEGYEFSPTFTAEFKDLCKDNILKESHTGSHTREGICIFNGEQINKSMEIEDACIEDIYPTILYYLDMAIPSHLDGKVLTSIFTEDFRRTIKLKFIDSQTGTQIHKKKTVFSDKDAKEIKKRLRDLGYID